MSTATTKEPKYENTTYRELCAMEIITRDKKRHEVTSVSGPVDFVVRISGVLVQAASQWCTRKQVDHVKLVRCLLVEMTNSQKQAAKERLRDTKRSSLRSNVTDWFDLVTTEHQTERSGPITGDLTVDLIELTDDQPESLAAENR